MNRNKLVKKAAVVGLSMALAAGQTISGIPYLVNAAEISKQESVYVNLNADGEASDITVTDWIKNVAITKTIKDSTELKDIFNVKGEETFSQSGKNLDWNAKNEDIYYQGKIDKELPVSMKITYFLDGKKMEANDLAGKSGKLKMQIAYENHAKETVLMDGKQIEINVPFAMLTGVILPTDRFKNVEIDHGKIMSDADKNIVVGIALPGMEESLDLSDDMKEDIEIPSSLTITADVIDFEMGATFTLATTEFMDDIDMTKTTKVDELKDSMDELKDASKKLVNGSADLADGVGTLKEKSGDFTSGITDLSDGLNQLYKGAGTLETGVKSYTSGADKLAAGVKKLGNAMKGLPEKLTELVTGISAAKSGTDQLVSSTDQLEKGMKSVNGGIDTVNTTLGQVNELLSSIEGAEENPQLQKAIQTISALEETTGAKGTLKNGAAAVETGLEKLNLGQKSLQSGLGTMQDGVSGLAGKGNETASLTNAFDQLNSGADELSKNSKSLAAGAENIKIAAGKLKEGGDKLNSGAGVLTNGITELKDGSVELRNGMKDFDKDGITKLYNLVNDEIDNMFERMDVISKAGKNYKSFAGINKDMNGTVRFIMETKEIK